MDIDNILYAYMFAVILNVSLVYSVRVYVLVKNKSRYRLHMVRYPNKKVCFYQKVKKKCQAAFFCSKHYWVDFLVADVCKFISSQNPMCVNN